MRKSVIISGVLAGVMLAGAAQARASLGAHLARSDVDLGVAALS